MSKKYKPTKAEQIILDYTSSFEWRQIKHLKFTTSEAMDIFDTYFKNLPTIEIDCPDCGGRGYTNIFKHLPGGVRRNQECTSCKDGKIKVIKFSDLEIIC